MDISTLLPWSEPKEINTKFGPRILRKATPTQEFWDLWRQRKADLKTAGISCSKNLQGQFEIAWWAKLDGQVEEQRSESIEASRATEASANFNAPCPPNLSYLPFQRAGIEYALQRDNVLIADEMGLGKTVQALGVLNATNPQKTLIICPASLKLNWSKEAQRWLIQQRSIQIVSSKDRVIGQHDITIINYDIVKKFEAELKAINWDLLIVDEAHYLKNHEAQRTRLILGYAKKGIKPIAAARRVFLTGTPILNRPKELWTLCEALDPKRLGASFWYYHKEFCNAHQTRFGWDFDGNSNLPKLQTWLRESFMIRRLKSDVLTDLPAKQRQIVTLERNGSKEILEKELAALGLKGDESYDEIVSKLDATSPNFMDISEIRHQVALAKVPYCVEYLKDAVESGPVVVFAHHRDVIDALQAAFPTAVKLYGGMSDADKNAAVEAFQSGKSNMFIGSIQAAGVGLTLTRSSHVIFCELDWTPGNVSQAEDRCHRIGQKDSVLVQHLVLDKSLDALMARYIIQKQEIIEKALNQKPEAITYKEYIPRITEEDRQPKAELVSAQEKAEIMYKIAQLLAVCDGAVKRDMLGFNGADAPYARSLMAQGFLTDKQALAAREMLHKYKNTQLKGE